MFKTLKMEDFCKLTTFNSQENDLKEIYLLIIVHGIGSKRESQEEQQAQLRASLQELIHDDEYYKSKYQYCVAFVDWKSCVVNLASLKRLNKCKVYSRDTRVERDTFHDVFNDALSYLSSTDREVLLTSAVQQMNSIYRAVKVKHGGLFKGKTSILGHSLGSVISYEILTLQDPKPRDFRRNSFDTTDADKL